MSWVFLKLLPLWDASKPHEGPGEAGLVQEDLSEPGAACRDGGNICATSGKLGRHRALPCDVKHFLEILSAWRKEMSCCPPPAGACGGVWAAAGRIGKDAFVLPTFIFLFKMCFFKPHFEAVHF